MVRLNWRMEDVWRIVLLESMRIQQVIVIGVIHRVCRVQGLHSSNVLHAIQDITFTDHNAINTPAQDQHTQSTTTVEYVNYVNGAVKYVQVHTIVPCVQEDSTFIKVGAIYNAH